MKMKISELKKIKPNSLFYRTFFSVMAVFALMGILVFLFMSNFMYNNIRNNMRSEYERTAETNISMIESEIRTVYRSMEQLANKEEIINAAIRPGINDRKNTSRTIKILSLLSNTARYTDAVKEIYLYETKTDEFYTNSNIVCKLNESEYRKRLAELLSGENENTFIHTREGNAFLKQDENDLFLCMNFLYSIDKPLSRLIIVLDKQYLFNSLPEGGNETYCIAEPDGRVIVQSDDWQSDSVKPEHLQEIKDSGIWEGNYFMVPSDSLGWIYVMKFNSDFAKLSPRQVLATICPLLVMFLIIAVILSVEVSMSISAPIGSIVDFLKNSDHESTERYKNATNEIDFLKKEYQHSVEKENYIQNVLKDISSEVVERVLIGLIQGAEQDRNEVKRIIENTGTSFSMDGRYSIIVASEKEGKDLSGKDFAPYMEKIRDLVLENAKDGNFGWYRVFYEGKMIDIFGFGRNSAPKDILVLLGNLKKRCIALSENWPFGICFGGSYTYAGIGGLKLAYSDAMGSLQRQQEPALTEEHRTEMLLSNSLTEKVKHLEKTVAQGRIDEAKEILNGIFSDISHYEDDGRILEAYRMLLHFIEQQEAEYRISLNAPSLHEKCHDSLEKADTLSTGETLKAYSSAVMKELDSVYIKRKNKYIVRSKEYIQKHYKDSGLNLSELADELEINKSYLSTIFNDILGIGFTEYLNSVRIAKAKELLESTSDSAGEIGIAVGFNSSQNFIRVFRKYVGVTPGQYRKSH